MARIEPSASGTTAWLVSRSIRYLLVPLVAYDYFSAKRLHPATIAASCMLLGAQGVVLLVWGNPGWRHLAYSFTVALRSSF